MCDTLWPQRRHNTPNPTYTNHPRTSHCSRCPADKDHRHANPTSAQPVVCLCCLDCHPCHWRWPVPMHRLWQLKRERTCQMPWTRTPMVVRGENMTLTHWEHDPMVCQPVQRACIHFDTPTHTHTAQRWVHTAPATITENYLFQE